MKAAVVTAFSEALEIVERDIPEPRSRAGAGPSRDVRAVPHRHPRGRRRLAGRAHAAVRPRPRGHRHHRGARRGRHEPSGRRARRHRVARFGLRRLPLLRRRSRDSVREPGEQRLLDRRRVRRVRRRQRGLRRPGARRHQLGRRRAAELRRRDDLQGHEGRPDPADRAGRRVRHRRPRPPRGPVRRASWAAPWWPSTSSNPSSTSPASSAPSTSSTPAATEPVAALQALGGLDVAVVLAASPHVFEQAFASLRRGGRLICVALARRRRRHDHPHLRDGAQGHLDHRLDRGHSPGPREVFALHAAGRTRVIAETRSTRATSTRPSPRCCPARSRRGWSSSTSPVPAAVDGLRRLMVARSPAAGVVSTCSGCPWGQATRRGWCGGAGRAYEALAARRSAATAARPLSLRARGAR